ncbi:MAG: hypothetical protein DDG60_02815 [Anaerolineae bacterium]|nr:MAG: hypothetical protein DDG60_02815 [Anaerolineae bacterium]
MKKWLGRGLFIALLSGLFYWALRNAPLPDIITLLGKLDATQLIWLVALNGIIFLLITARWWLILRAESRHIPFGPLIGYRLAAFGLSYFTPGPQVGGEPLQIVYLQKQYRLSFARATSAVIMDKLLEFLANFLFLGIGFLAIARSGILTRYTPPPWISLPLILLLVWPLAHILLMYFNKHPLSALLAPLVRIRHIAIKNTAQPPNTWWMNLLNIARLIALSEHLAGTFCRRHFGYLLLSLSASLLVWVGMVYEYLYMLTCFQAQLTFEQALASLTIVRLSFLAPLPAGLGALEASQVLAASAFGLPAALGISLSLLMRARDLLLGGLGLLIAAFNK